MASPAILNRAALLDTLARCAPPVLYGLGVALLLRRYLGLEAISLCIIAAAGLVIAALADGLTRRRYDAAYFRAWLDLNNAGGGRIMAGDDRVLVGRLPGLSGKYFLKRILYPALFLIVAALVPAPEPPDRGTGAGLLRAASAIGRDIDQAAADELLNERQRQELRKQVERVRELTRENNREAAAEALASLRERLDRTLAESYESAAETLEKAASMAQELAAAKAEGDAQAIRAAEQALADLRASLELSENLTRSRTNPLENRLQPEDKASQGSYGQSGQTRSGTNTQTGTNSDYAEMLEALERHGRELAEAGAGGGRSGSEQTKPFGDATSAAGASSQDGQAGTSAARGRAAAASRRLQTATEALATLRERGTAATPVYGMDSTGIDVGNGENNGAGAGGRTASSAAAYGSSSQSGENGPGRGGIARGPGAAPLVLADGTRRGDRPLDYVPLTATGQSRFDGPELQRSRSEIGDRLEPEARRRASQSAIDAPDSLGAGATAVAPGPSRSRWVDAYFDAVNNQSDIMHSREGYNQ